MRLDAPYYLQRGEQSGLFARGILSLRRRNARGESASGVTYRVSSGDRLWSRQRVRFRRDFWIALLSMTLSVNAVALKNFKGPHAAILSPSARCREGACPPPPSRRAIKALPTNFVSFILVRSKSPKHPLRIPESKKRVRMRCPIIGGRWVAKKPASSIPTKVATPVILLLYEMHLVRFSGITDW